jgi:hypothetical protein
METLNSISNVIDSIAMITGGLAGFAVFVYVLISAWDAKTLELMVLLFRAANMNLGGKLLLGLGGLIFLILYFLIPLILFGVFVSSLSSGPKPEAAKVKAKEAV